MGPLTFQRQYRFLVPFSKNRHVDDVLSDAEKLVTLGIGFTPSFSISIQMGTATAVNTIVSSLSSSDPVSLQLEDTNRWRLKASIIAYSFRPVIYNGPRNANRSF